MNDKIQARLDELIKHAQKQNEKANQLVNELETVKQNLLQTQGAIVEFSLLLKGEANDKRTDDTKNGADKSNSG